MASIIPDQPSFKKAEYDNSLDKTSKHPTQEENTLNKVFSESINHTSKAILSTKTDKDLTMGHSFENISIEDMSIEEIERMLQNVKSEKEKISSREFIVEESLKKTPDLKSLFFTFMPGSNKEIEIDKLTPEELEKIDNIVIITKDGGELFAKSTLPQLPPEFERRLKNIRDSDGKLYTVTITQMSKQEFEQIKLQLLLQYGIQIGTPAEKEKTEDKVNPFASQKPRDQASVSVVDDRAALRKEKKSKEVIATLANHISKTAFQDHKTAIKRKEHYAKLLDQEDLDRKDRIRREAVKYAQKITEQRNNDIKRES